MMTNLLTQLSSPRPSSGYGSSEDELNFLFHRHPTTGLVTPTSDLSTSSSSLWISTSGLSGRTFGLSTPTSGLLTPTTSDEGSCPVTPNHVTSVVEFPPVFDLFDDGIGVGSDGGFFTVGMDLGEVCSGEELTDLRGPLLNELSCLGLELEFGDSTGCSEPASNAYESLDRDGNLLAALLKRPRSLYPLARDIKTEALSPCASADPLIASHQMPNCSAPRDDLPLDHLSRLIRSNSSGERSVTDELVLPGNRCYRRASSPATSGDYAKRPSNGNQGKASVRVGGRWVGGSSAMSNPVKNAAYVSMHTVEESAHQTTARTRPHVIGGGQSLTASGSRTSTGCRRSFSELDDHRYSSSPHSYGSPPTKVARLARTASSRATSPRATILETFLLTKEPLRANAGSDAMLAVNGVAQLHRKSSSLSSNHFHEGKSVLEGLLTETNNYPRGREPTVSEPAAFDPKRTVAAATGSNPKSLVSEPRNRVEGVNVTRNQISRKSQPSSYRSQSVDNNCGLLTDHLFADCDAMQLAQTPANDEDDVGQEWIPCRLDDRVFSSEVDDILRQHFQSDDLMTHPFLSDLLCEPKTF